ncbi:5-formyltetrahydrofolate cyclo-ligase [Larkinella ripae]
MTKAELRVAFRQKRRALSETDWQNRSEAIAALFFAAFLPQPASALASFLPIESRKEVNTWLIIRKLWRDFPQVRVGAPVTDLKTGTLAHYALTPGTPLTLSPNGIPEPPASSSVLHPSAFDCSLIPLLAFDQAGHRVGYGGGFYDRFLADCRPDCLKIGLSLFDPIAKITDVYEQDVALNACITPGRVWRFS